MARHNQASVLARVEEGPKVRQTIDGKQAKVKLATIMGDRDYHEATTGYQKRAVYFYIMSQEKNIVETIESLETNDIVDITGFIATKEIERKAKCPSCGQVNTRREACVKYGNEKSGGVTIYIYPIALEVRARIGYEYPPDEAELEAMEEEARQEELERVEVANQTYRGQSFQYLYSHRGDVNRICVVGNVTCDPRPGTLMNGKKIYTRYQVAVNRKYCPKGADEYYERTDYPWIYSYGEKSIDDNVRIRKGSLILVDGALQSRKYKEEYTCQHCGTVYQYAGETLEILSYGTEYLKDPPEEKDEGQETETENEE